MIICMCHWTRSRLTTLHFVEEPVEIMDREVKTLKHSKISIVKVCWNSKHGPEFTWEREDHMKARLFARFCQVAEHQAPLEKKRTRLRTNTKTLEDLCSQSLETVSLAILDAITTHQVTVSHISRLRHPASTQTQI
ncbi:hypothetical protein Tco_0024417 [Tanacetum coccineum]